jgi:hypothetical protein
MEKSIVKLQLGMTVVNLKLAAWSAAGSAVVVIALKKLGLS